MALIFLIVFSVFLSLTMCNLLKTFLLLCSKKVNITEKLFERKYFKSLDKFEFILKIVLKVMLRVLAYLFVFFLIGVLLLYILTFKKIRIVVRNNELVYNYKKNNEIFNFDTYRFKAIVRGERRQYRLEATNENGEVKLINCDYLGWKNFKELINELKIDTEYIN